MIFWLLAYFGYSGKLAKWIYIQTNKIDDSGSFDTLAWEDPYRKFMYGNYVYFVLFYSYQMILLKSTE